MAGLYGGIIDEFASCLPPPSPARSVAESLAALSVAEQRAEQALDEAPEGTTAHFTTEYDAPGDDVLRETNFNGLRIPAPKLAAELDPDASVCADNVQAIAGSPPMQTHLRRAEDRHTAGDDPTRAEHAARLLEQTLREQSVETLHGAAAVLRRTRRAEAAVAARERKAAERERVCTELFTELEDWQRTLNAKASKQARQSQANADRHAKQSQGEKRFRMQMKRLRERAAEVQSLERKVKQDVAKAREREMELEKGLARLARERRRFEASAARQREMLDAGTEEVQAQRDEIEAERAEFTRWAQAQREELVRDREIARRQLETAAQLRAQGQGSAERLEREQLEARERHAAQQAAQLEEQSRREAEYRVREADLRQRELQVSKDIRLLEHQRRRLEQQGDEKQTLLYADVHE